MGRHKDAVRAYSESARQWEGVSPHFHAQTLHGMTLSLLSAGMPDVAAAKMVELSRLLPFVSSAMLEQEIGGPVGVLRTSSRWTSVPVVREAREQLASVIIPSRRAH